MKMTKGLLMTALITGTLMSSTAAFAEELQEYTLDQMVVTATRYEKRDVEVAASTEVLDTKKLEQTGATNLYDALKFGAGLEAHQYGPAGSSMGNMTSKIVMRGNANGTLVLVNGIPLNARGTYDLTDIPVENIERVEIVRGGGSVLYGSEATGGVINIITKKTKQNYVKAAVGNDGRQEYSGSFQAEGFGFGYKYTKVGTTENVASDGRDWKGPENNNFDLSYQINERLLFTAGHNDSKYHYITEGKKATDTKQHVKRNNLQLAYDDNGFKATAYYVDRNREKDAITLKTGKLAYDEENNKNFGLDLQKTWNLNDGDVALVGANYKAEQYTPYEQAMQSRNNYSVYASYEKQFDEKNTLALSARESWTTGAPNDYNNTNFSGQVQYTHKLAEDTNLYASIGQSYKMPDLHQIYKTKAGADLKAQTGMHYELGLKKDFDDFRKARIALFSYKVKDNITAKYDEKFGDFTYENEDLKNTGIEAEYSLSADKGFGYSLSASYSSPKTRNMKKGVVGDWERDYAKLYLKAGLTYRMDKFSAALNAAYTGDRVLSDKDTTPSLITNFNAEYQMTKNGSVFLTVNNILDREDISYRSSSAEYYYTPINFLIGVKYSF